DPMKAFCGFGCSFGGRYFEGYARPKKGVTDPKCFAYATRNALLRDCKNNIHFLNLDFLLICPIRDNRIIYLDPPYEGTKPYSGMVPLDRMLFVERIKQWSKYSHVFVSEYSFPIGAVIFEKSLSKKVAGGGSGGGRVGYEKLFHIPKGSHK